MSIIFVIIACILSAILYRAGGMSQAPDAKPTWIPTWMRQSWVRDWLCPVVLLGLTLLLFGISSLWWLYVITYALSGAALSTYWDWLFGEDNFYMHGLVCGIAGVPLIWAGVPWWIIVPRIVVCAVGMGLWSKLTDKDYVEEMGRGVFFII